MAQDRTRTYATLQRLRKLEEENRARDMMLAYHAAARGQRLREALEQTRQSALEHAAELMRQPAIDASDMRTYYQYERHLAGAIDRQDAENRLLDRALAERRQALNAAAVQRRIAERLVEREQERKAQARALWERKQMDEAAIVRALQTVRKAGDA